MKKLILIIAIISSGNLLCQSVIQVSSVVVDRISRQPMAYANVGFIDRGLGTVTDKEGYFELSFLEKRIAGSDTLQITAQGFYPLRIAFSDLKPIMDKTKILYLSRNPENLKSETSVDKKKLIKDQIKSTGVSGVEIGWSEKDMKGSELASLLNLPSNTSKLERIKFKVSSQKADSTLVRVNIYDALSGTPGKKIANSVLHVIKNKSGEEIIDISNQDVIVNEQIIVGLELLDSYGSDSNQLQLSMSEQVGTSFIKSTSQDSWQEIPFNSIDFSLDILRSDEVVSKENNNIEEQKITGIVKSSKKPFQGCEVRIKGRLNSTYTDQDGYFSIAASEGDVLQFRSLVTEPKDIIIEGQNNIKVTLKSKYSQLSEVVINSEKENSEDDEVINTPFGFKKKRSLGYGAFSKDRDQLNKFAYTFSGLIAGKFPGVRGSSSFLISNTRAIIVDGVPFIGDTDVLDPNNIANVTVVNGLAGAARYGTYGRNGVILVTTKTAMLNREYLLRKERENSLLVKDNDYDGLAQQYQNSKSFETSASNLKNASSFEMAKAIHLRELEKNSVNLNFFKEAFTYFLKWDEKYACQILEIAVNIAYDNAKALRAVAFIYEENEKFDIAHEIYKRIGELEPQRAQTYMDLAQSYVSIGKYQEAFSLYKLILDNKIPGVVFGDTILEIAVTEVKYLVTRHKIDVDYRDLHPSFYSKAQDLDGRIVFEWNDPQSEFDIQFVNPNGKYFVWQHSVVAQANELSKERIEGYNTKEFILEESDPGVWLVNIKGHNRSEKEYKIPRLIKCTVYKNYGMPHQSKKVKLIELDKIFDENISIASLQLD